MSIRTLEDVQNTYGFTVPLDFYVKAKEKYEKSGETIMTDGDFDILESWLLESNQINERMIGIDVSDDDKVPLYYPMYSIETKKSGELSDSETFQKFFEKKHEGLKHDSYSLSWKYDGMALQAEYVDGKRKHVLTRGAKTHGHDVTAQVEHVFPEYVDPSIRAIIGEAVLLRKDFEQHFTNYKNPRNAVSGIINSSNEKRAHLRQFIHFVAFKLVDNEMNVLCAWDHAEKLLTMECASNFGVPQQQKLKLSKLYSEIEKMEKERPVFPYQTDGVVIRNNYADLDEINKGLYHAYTAFKYDAVQVVTKIKDIDFRICNNGALFARGILEPVEIDGTTVSHASLFNYGKMIKEGLFPGAEVIVVKSGDIIPYVEMALNPVYETPEFREKFGIDKYSFDGVNLFTDEDISEIKFIGGIEKLQYKDVGDALAKILFDNFGEVHGILGLFKLKDHIEEVRSSIGKVTKPIDAMLNKIIKDFENVSITRLIQAMRFSGVGETTSKRIAAVMTENLNPKYNVGYNAKLILANEKLNVYEADFIHSEEYESLCKAIRENFDRINFDGVKQVISETALKVVLTGSPKEFGYSKKTDFITAMKSKGIEIVEVKGIKDADVLITDDLSSTSSKMKQAEKLGKPIKTYGEY